MKTKITLVAALAFFGFFSLQCKKKNNLDELGLPKATQTGRNIFACRYNGSNWVRSYGAYDYFVSSFSNDTLYVSAIGDTNNEGTSSYRIALQVNKLSHEGSYSFDATNQYAIIKKTNCFNYSDSTTIKSNNGEIIISKLDRSKKIISGTFWFDIPTDKCGVLKVTDGRFDVRYY